MPGKTSGFTTPASPSPNAPALQPVPLPLPAPAPAPQQQQQEKYSEGSMYDALPEEDIQAWHGRYANFKRWREEVPAKRLRELGMGAVGGTGSTATFGRGVGVGSAVWSSTHAASEGSDTGTVPSTVVAQAKKRGDERAWAANGSAVAAPAATGVSVTNGKTTPSKTVAQPVEVPTVLVQSLLRPSTQKLAELSTVRAQPSTVHPAKQAVTAVTNGTVTRPTPSRTPSASRAAPMPALAQGSSEAQQQARQQQQHLSVSRSHSHYAAKSTSKPPSQGSPTSSTARAPHPAPGEFIVPSPTPSATHAEREAYLASTIDLPLDMLRETQDQPRKMGSASSSKFTTGRLESLLGQSRENLNPPGASQRQGSSTTLPEKTVKSPVEQGVGLSRSHTVAAPQSRRSQMAVEDLAPGTQSGSVAHQSRPARSRPDLRATVETLPPSATSAAHAQSQTQTQTQMQAPIPPRPSQPVSSYTHNAPSRPPEPIQPPSVGSEATIIKASRQALPLSRADTANTLIKVPASVVTAAGSQPANGSAYVAHSTQSQRSVVPPVSSARPSQAAPISVRQPTVQSNPTAREAETATHPALEPQYIPLPPTIQTQGSLPPPISRVSTHRQQMPLPRPSLTPQVSFDGFTRATSLGRRHRDPSLADLTAHFPPEMYPLPPSGGTLISSPEAAKAASALRNTRSRATTLADPRHVPSHSAKSGTRAPPASPTAPEAPAGTARSQMGQAPSRSASISPANIPLPDSMAAPTSITHLPTSAAPTASLRPPHPESFAKLQHETSAALFLPAKSVATASPTNLEHHTLEIPAPPSASSAQNHITFSPAPTSPERLRSEDDHVSFEVPSGSRGRLRVTLKWLKDGGRSGRSERQSVASSVDSPPPRPPPKPKKYQGDIFHTGDSRVTETRPVGKEERRRCDRDTEEQLESHIFHVHPIAPDQRPPLDPVTIKSHDAKRDESLSPNQQYGTGLGGGGWYTSNPNPYYSGATLPAYNAPQPQMFNVQMPYAYPQPQAQAQAQGWGAYRLSQAQAQGLGLNMGIGRGGGEGLDSPRESVDPPSSPSPEGQPAPLPARMGQGYPGNIMGTELYPQPLQQQQQQQQQQRPQPWWAQTQRAPNTQKQSMWSKLFGNNQQREREDDLGPDDSVTVRNWQRNVAPGRAPTLAPLPLQPIRPTVVPTPTGFPGLTPAQTWVQRAKSRPTMTIVPQTAVFGAGDRYRGTPLPSEMGRSDLYKSRNRARGGEGGRGREREKERSKWEKLMWRRVDERVYVSPPRRDVPLPSSRNPTDDWERRRPRMGGMGAYSPLSFRARERDRDRRAAGTRGDRPRMDEREATRREREADKERRRKAKAARRNQRVKASISTNIDPPSGYQSVRPAGGGGGRAGARTSRDDLARARERPRDAWHAENGTDGRGGKDTRDARGRTGTMVADWVGRIGRTKYPKGMPDSAPQVRDYKPWKTRLGLRLPSEPVPAQRVNTNGTNADKSRVYAGAANSTTAVGRSGGTSPRGGIERRGTLKLARPQQTSEGSKSLLGRLVGALSLGPFGAGVATATGATGGGDGHSRRSERGRSSGRQGRSG